MAGPIHLRRARALRQEAEATHREARPSERPLTDAECHEWRDADGLLDRTILVADDLPMFRELASLFLARSARIVTAETGDEALLLAQQGRPDLILADLHMPGMSGDELCRAIKADPELCHTPVLVMIGSQDSGDRAAAVRAGADDLLTKPLDRVGLIEAVGRFLRWQEVRGLPRIDCSLPVGVERAGVERDEATSWGMARNMSRGGLFVETVDPVDLEMEVSLRFALPEIPHEFCPTAQVIWRSDTDSDQLLRGMGLRFLEIDRRAERQLDEYVFHHRFSRELPLMGELP